MAKMRTCSRCGEPALRSVDRFTVPFNSLDDDEPDGHTVEFVVRLAVCPACSWVGVEDYEMFRCEEGEPHGER
ncbi:MAG: hypothetical protein KatS3mg051_2035 [Anaerolineae bacterium]|nr:MAG: hypothetical protein KatS3mg051_2035 [Anaerolineae bacterium]